MLTPQTARRLKVITYRTDTAPETLKKTVELIGEAIHSGSTYLPIRSHAAGLASKAGPKDYLGQVKAIYDDFIQRWRYVHDPLAAETVTTTGPAIWAQTLGGRATPGTRGFGDCDDATTAIGSMLAAIGLPVRIRTIAGPRTAPHQLFTHVYPEVHIPRLGWLAVDAVGHPAHGFGWRPPASRGATWTTAGKLVSIEGHYPPRLEAMLRAMIPKTRMAKRQALTGVIDTMTNQNQWQDLGLDRYGLCGTGYGGEELEDFAKVGLLGFGAYAGQMGIIQGDTLGILMEYDEEDEDETAPEMKGLVRTKMLEMSPEDIQHVRATGRPRLGAVALADDGDIYQYQDPTGYGGFFKKLSTRVKKGVKKVWSKAKGIARKIVKKLPGGKYLLKLHDRIHKIAMKLVRPLRKFVGKFAAKLAPIAALIPGYGPAIAGALYTAGKIAKVMDEFDVRTDKKGRPKFKSGDQAKKFKAALAIEAQREKEKSGQAKKGRRSDARQSRALPAAVRKNIIDMRMLTAGSKAHKAAMRGLGLSVDW